MTSNRLHETNNDNNNNNKERNMNLTVVPVIVGVFETILKNLKKVTERIGYP